MKKFDIYENDKDNKPVKTNNSIFANDLFEAQRIFLDRINVSLVEDDEYKEGDKVTEKGGEVKYVSN